jgi:hypothetical protein
MSTVTIRALQGLTLVAAIVGLPVFGGFSELQSRHTPGGLGSPGRAPPPVRLAGTVSQICDALEARS